MARPGTGTGPGARRALRPGDLPQHLADDVDVGGEAGIGRIGGVVVGGPGWLALIDILARGGRYILARGGRYTCSGAIAGPVVALDLRSLYLRDLTFTGSTVVPSHVFRDVVGYIERGEVRPVLAATWPLSELRAAQLAFIDKRHVGNIVVVP